MSEKYYYELLPECSKGFQWFSFFFCSFVLLLVIWVWYNVKLSMRANNYMVIIILCSCLIINISVLTLQFYTWCNLHFNLNTATQNDYAKVYYVRAFCDIFNFISTIIFYKFVLIVVNFWDLIYQTEIEAIRNNEQELSDIEKFEIMYS